MSRRCLGIDCGEHTGIAVLDQPRVLVHCELFRCRHTRFDTSGVKFMLFERRVKELLEEFKPDLVAYEIWNAHKGLQAAQALAGYLATLTKVLEELRVPGVGLNVQEIKQHATGSRYASKDKMLKAANLLWPKAGIVSHDTADALHIARKGIDLVLNQ